MKTEDQRTVPKLVMGHIEVMTPDDEVGIPYDEAVIHLEGDDDSEIEIRCPGALRLAPQIIQAVNNYASTVKALERILDITNGVNSSALCWLRLEDVRNIATTILTANNTLKIEGSA